MLKDHGLLSRTLGIRFGSKYGPKITALCHYLQKRLESLKDDVLQEIQQFNNTEKLPL